MIECDACVDPAFCEDFVQARPDVTCEWCGGYVSWTDCGDHWEGACYGDCAQHPVTAKAT
jgi:hypothetical protein